MIAFLTARLPQLHLTPLESFVGNVRPEEEAGVGIVDLEDEAGVDAYEAEVLACPEEDVVDE